RPHKHNQSQKFVMPGLKKGQRHDGQFKSGHDPRRHHGDGVRLNGLSLSAMARELTPDCLTLLHIVVRGVDEQGSPREYKPADRLRAATYILDRGWGTAVQNIELSLHDARPVQSLSRAELEALAAGELPRLPVTIQGEAISQAISESGGA